MVFKEVPWRMCVHENKRAAISATLCYNDLGRTCANDLRPRIDSDRGVYEKVAICDLSNILIRMRSAKVCHPHGYRGHAIIIYR